MKILLVNPPVCGRSIPEERYGIDSLRRIFRGEPLGLEALAGNLPEHEVRILDLKADPGGLEDALAGFRPGLVGFTAVTCEANTVVRMAGQVKEACGAVVAVGGVHASCDPSFFNRPGIDYVVVGLGKASFAELAAALARDGSPECPPGVARTRPGGEIAVVPRKFGAADLAESRPPRYDLVAGYRDSYTLHSLGLRLGFVSSSFGCPCGCSFCCIPFLTGGRYLTHAVETVIADIRALGDLPVIRLVDANTFGDPAHAARLADGILAAGIRKNFVADVRPDTVVRHPELLRRWKQAGLRSVVVGFEEVADDVLASWDKRSTVAVSDEAVSILRELGISIVGDFIVSPDYDEARFDALERYVSGRRIDLPVLTVLTPVPGQPLFAAMSDRLVLRDLDYYTFTNAVVPTLLDEKRFYERYAELTKRFHENAKL
jgi:hopanoid C-3 methylase